MGSQSPFTLPIIAFSDLRVGCPKWNLVKDQVKQAFEEYGCFEAVLPEIPLESRRAVFGSLEELFNLPLETKLKNKSEKPHYGFLVRDNHSGMAIEDPHIPEKVETFTNLLWPQGNADFKESIQSYCERLSELDQTVRRMILESLGLEDYLNEHLDSTKYLLRVMEYKVPITTESKVGLKSHKDNNVLTIVGTNQVSGLEVQTKDGEWINVTPSPDSFIVFYGQSLYAWTNGRFHSPYHRVTMREERTRYSTALFTLFKDGYIVKAPKKLIDEQHPLLFNPFDSGKFMEFIYTEAGQNAEAPLKAYCGV